MSSHDDRDLMLSFVLGTGSETGDVVRGHVFESDPAQARTRPVWEDMHRTFEVDIRLRGQSDVGLGDITFTCTPGDVVLIAAWERHTVFSEALPGAYLVVQFLPEFLGSRTVGGIPWLSFFATPAAGRPRVPPPLRNRVLAIAQELRYEVEELPFGWEDGARAELLRLLLLLARSSPFDPSPTSDFGRRQAALARLMPAVTLVYSDPSVRHNIAEAASACRLGVRHFSSEFKRVMGVTFADFSLRVRLKRAAELLTLTDLSVETIADRTGFTDHSHLSRSFASGYGSTPTEYRRSPAHH